MPEEVFIISLVAIVFGSGLIGAVMYGIYSLIKAKINQANSSSGDINPQFFKALGEFKKNTERRITNLEAIVSDLEEEKIRVPESSSAGDITIEDEDIRVKKDEKDDNNLKNMLNE